MQLIFETQPTESIKINMSTQAESSTNEDFTNIICKHINIGDGIVSNPELCLSKQTETEIDRVMPETVDESALTEEKCLGNTNEKKSKKCSQNAIESINQSDLIQNANSITNENIITNGRGNSKDDIEPEYETIHEKITTENVSIINKEIDRDSNPTIITIKHFDSLTDEDELAKGQHSKLELCVSDDTTKCVSKDVDAEDRTQIFIADADLKLKASSTNDKETIDVIPIIVENKSEAENVTTLTYEYSIDNMDAGKNYNEISTNDTPSAVHREELIDIFKKDHIHTIISDNNISINEDNVVTPEAVTIRDETAVVNVTLEIHGVKDSEDITMEEDTNNSRAINTKRDVSSQVVPMENEISKKYTAPSVHKEELVNTFQRDQVKPDNNSSIDEDNALPSELSENALEVSTEAVTISDMTTVENETLEIHGVKDSEDITMEEDTNNLRAANNKKDHYSEVVTMNDNIHKQSEVTVDIELDDKVNTVTSNPVLENEKLSIIDEKLPEVISHEGIMKPSDIPALNNKKVTENVITSQHDKLAINDDRHLDAVVINDENRNKTSAITGADNDENINSRNETSETTVTHNDENLNLTLENTENPQCEVLENDKPVLIVQECGSVQNKNTLPEQNESELKLIPEKEKTHDVSLVVPAAKLIINENIIAVDKSSEDKANSETVMSSITIYEKIDDDDEVQHVPMEIDEIEIVDLDKDSQDESISESMTSTDIQTKEFSKEDQEKVEILDEDDIKIVENKTDGISTKTPTKEKSPERKETNTLPVVCKLSNTLDILSDDEDESPKQETTVASESAAEKQCINIDDDDDIMLIEDSNSKDQTNEDEAEVLIDEENTQPQQNNTIYPGTGENENITTEIVEMTPQINEKESSPLELDSVPIVPIEENEKDKTPLLPKNFLKTAKKNLVDMTRDELEDFCVLRIIESIVDRTNLSEIKTKMKIMTQTLENLRKRALMLTKQNRDLQVVLKSVEEEQKKPTNVPIQPLKITRSVGIQVLMNEKVDTRRKGLIQLPSVPVGKPVRAPQKVIMKTPTTPTPIPVPRKVPVNNTPNKALTTTPTNNVIKGTSPSPALRHPSPVQKPPEKRAHSRTQAMPIASTVTVDLTDDEPPAKVIAKSSPAPVRVVAPQNLMPQPRAFVQSLNGPRKVYIPISAPQGQAVQAIRPGQTIMMKGVQVTGPRQRVGIPMPRMQQGPMRFPKPQGRHPAPLPDPIKQYTPPTWNSLPPAPDLKLSKVENGIVISWKMDQPETAYEEVASYQLYAYQETNAPPCTALWKKIGDVKALPLPMACTLTQFMAGFKYYFAVRAVDIRSRIGPFSLPGSILLLNKM